MLDAAVEPDAEINTWVLRAAAAARSGNDDGALSMLLPLLKTGPGVLASTNGVTFVPARKLAAELIRSLPERTLAAYRLQATAGARLPAGQPPPADVTALEALYRSGLSGPAAADTGLRLAALYLDQQRFRDARRILREALDAGGAGRGKRSELLARLLVACARVGDTAEAEWAWTELQKEDDAGRWLSLAAEVRPAAAAASNAWLMAYGGPSRSGASDGAAVNLASNIGWLVRWRVNLGPGFVQGGPYSGGDTNPPPSTSLTRTYAAACMTDRNLRPADDFVFSGTRAFVNGFRHSSVLDLDSGRVIQRVPHLYDPMPVGTGQSMLNIVLIIGQGGANNAAESWVFGNRLKYAASLIGGRVYCVEEDDRAALDGLLSERRMQFANRPATGPQPNGNALAAYEAETGRLLWRIGRDVAPPAPSKDAARWKANAIRFVAAPVPCAGLLLAPLEDESGLGIAGLDAESGAPVWRTRLASSVPLASQRTKPVAVTVDGADAFLCAGNGQVTALDGADGSVLWTTLYEAAADAAPTNTVGADDTKDTWEESLVLVAGAAVVALPEGAREILAFDRRKGTRLWTQPKPEGVDYVVGRRDTALIAAGGKTAVCVDLTTGRERWRTPIGGSTGRGTLCGQDVLIPCGLAILRLRAADGAALDPMRTQPADDLPLGNLYVNGNQLLVAGPERLYALADARRELDRVSGSLALQPTAEAFAGRGRLYAAIERFADAVADLREAWKLQRGSDGEEAARVRLMEMLWRAANQDSGAAEKFHEEAGRLAASDRERTEAAWRRARDRERNGDAGGALDLYAALLAAPDALIAPTLGDAIWEASAHQLAASRIRLLSGAAAGRKPVLPEEPAAQALSRLGAAAALPELVDMAMRYPGTAASAKAAFRAARLAADRGDLGTAETVLQRTLTTASPSDRAAAAGELARLYGLMKWPRGLSRLRYDWTRLCPGTRLPEVLDSAPAKPGSGSVPAAAQPPWRLRWRKKIPANTTVAQIVPAGLFYSGPAAGGTGCLALDTGLPRWQKELPVPLPPAGATRFSWDDLHTFPTTAGDCRAVIDFWSGAVTTNALPASDDFGGRYDTLSRPGVATSSARTNGGTLTAADALTGRILWKRGNLEPLLGAGVLPVPYSSSAIGVFLMRCEPDGAGTVVALDPWTGDIAFRCTVVSGGRQLGRTAAQGGVWSVAFPYTPEREAPAVTDQRLYVRDRRTGAALWTTPADMPIARGSPLPEGMVLAETAEHELILFDSGNGRILCRSGQIRPSFDSAVPGTGSDAVIATRRVSGEHNEVLALDPVSGRIVFHGTLPLQFTPVASLGPKTPNVLLAAGMPMIFRGEGQFAYGGGILAVNEQGENINGWRLPKADDAGNTAPSSGYTPLFADGLILLLDQASGDVLAYEHDPGPDGRKP